MLNQYTIKILHYNKHFIIKINHTPKLKVVGNGVMLRQFNNNDVLISFEALEQLKKHYNNKKDNPVIEVVNNDTIWIASYNNIIIPDTENINVFDIPYCTLIKNDIDQNIKNFLI